MTHSNHRRGSRKSLLGDWVILVRGDVGGKPNEMKRIIEIFAAIVVRLDTAAVYADTSGYC